MEEAPCHSLGELINTHHESGGPHLNPLRWLQGDSEQSCYRFWPPGLSGSPSVLIKEENENVRYGDIVRQKHLTRWSR